MKRKKKKCGLYQKATANKKGAVEQKNRRISIQIMASMVMESCRSQAVIDVDI